MRPPDTGPGRHHGRDTTDALLVAAGQGDVTALAAFYDRTAPSVFGLLSTVMGRTEAAAQATEQVYLHLWRTAPAFDPRARSARATVLFLARRALSSHILGRHAESGAGPDRADERTHRPG